MADKRHEKQALAERFGSQACLFVTVWVICLPLARATDGGTLADQSTGSLRRGRALLSTLQQQGTPLMPETISAGDEHTCALTTEGSAYCWGDNEYGELGDGTTVDKSTPTLVKGGMQWSQISAGGYHTCALATDGSAYCWGRNYDGQLGDGTIASPGAIVAKPTPTLVSGGMQWSQISASFSHTCAVATDGSAYCWGDNEYGQLGDGTNPVDKSTPTLVSGSEVWSQISAGDWYTCALATDSSAYCWGEGLNGKLGNGATTDKSTPTLVKGGMQWSQISAGGHTCALTTDGSAYCWGANGNGQLGDGTTVDKSTPTLVSADGTVLDTLCGQISAGSYHTCAVAIDQIYTSCWGDNEYGQLGDWTTFTGPTFTSQIIVGGRRTCALLTDDSINYSAYCWGGNDVGQLGDGTTLAKSTPTLVMGGILSTPMPSSPPPTVPSPSPFPPPTPVNPPVPSQPPPAPGAGPPPEPVSQPPPAPGAVPPLEPTDSSGMPIAAIAGAVVGGVCILGAVVVWFAVRARKRKHVRQPQEQDETVEFEKMHKGVTRPEDSLVLTLPGPNTLLAPPPMSVDRAASDQRTRTASDPVLRWIDGHSVTLRSTHSPPNTQQGEPPAGEVPAYVRDLEFAWSEVRVMKALGFGSFGKVFLAEVGHAQVAVKLLLDAKTVASASSAAVQAGSAVPKLQGPDVAVASRAALVNEVAAMAPLRHANVVQLLGFCTAPPALATEYCSRGSVFDLLQKGRCDPETASWLSWSVRLRMAADSAAGMHHLHTRSPPIVHRDLKTPNLLVAGDWVVKVADMGLSKLVVDAMHASTAGGATNPRWLAPEAFRGERLTAASDVFSFGVVMWELLTWRVPWDDANPMAIPVAVVRGDRLAVPEMAALPGFSDGDRRTHASSLASYVALMRRCWAADPSARPTFSDIAAELRAASD